MNTDVEAERRLASEVIQQAFLDLTATPSPRASENTRIQIERDRRSAQEFLLTDLWKPDCVWSALLGLNQRTIRNEAKRRIGGAL